MTETIVTTKGVIGASTYTKEDSKSKIIRDLAADIFYNLPEFKDDIVVIIKVKAKEGSTMSECIKEFVETNKDYKDKLIFAQAGILTVMKVQAKISEGLNILNDEKNGLIQAGFKNIIFNRRMSKTSANGDYFIYNNKAGKDFIKKNLGDNDSKIINRVSE